MKVSVVIPFFNGSGAFLEAVHSALLQTPESPELIIVDDCSSGESKKYLSEASKLGARIITLEDNVGQSEARNIGANHSSSQFLCFLDQDDIWPTFHNHQLMEVFSQQPDTDLVVGEYVLPESGLIYPAGGRVKPALKQLKQTEIMRHLTKGLHYVPGAMMVRREVFVSLNGFDSELRGFEDEDFVVRAITSGHKVVETSTPVLYWRQNQDSSSYSYSFLKSRSHYLNKLVTSAATLGIKKPQLALMWFRYELLTCWDALALELDPVSIKEISGLYANTRSMFRYWPSPLRLLSRFKARGLRKIRSVAFSNFSAALLVNLRIVHDRNKTRLVKIQPN